MRVFPLLDLQVTEFRKRVRALAFACNSAPRRTLRRALLQRDLHADLRQARDCLKWRDAMNVRLVVVSWCLLCLPATGWAQSQTGAITGGVRDSSGAVIPGVTVEAASPALIERVRSVTTDEQGLYRIVDLRPGLYTVTFTLAGFGTFRRDGIELTTGFTATVNGELKVGTVEETVTVTGESPVVDVQNVQQQTTIPRNTLDALPIAGRPSQFITL